MKKVFHFFTQEIFESLHGQLLEVSQASDTPLVLEHQHRTFTDITISGWEICGIP